MGAYLNLGAANLDLGSLEEAVRVFREGLAVAPSDARLHCNPTVALRSLGRAEEALLERQRAISLDPEAAKWSF